MNQNHAVEYYNLSAETCFTFFFQFLCPRKVIWDEKSYKNKQRYFCCIVSYLSNVVPLPTNRIDWIDTDIWVNDQISYLSKRSNYL